MTTVLTRRQTLFGTLALPFLDMTAHAADTRWPAQVVKLMVGGAPGSVPDTVARIAADALAQKLGQPMIIENRPGAGGIVAMQSFIASTPDGYTLGFATASQAVFNGYLYSKLPYDPARDLQPISLIAATSFVLAAHPSMQAATLTELVALSKTPAGNFLIGVPVNGSPPHIAALLLLQKTGLNASFVPFRSGPDALRAAMRGDVQLIVDGPTLIAPQVKDGALKALMVTSHERHDILPDVPTATEAGFAEVECESWMGLVAPRGTPSDIVARVSRECSALLTAGGYRSRLETLSVRPVASSPAEFASFIGKEHERWSPVLQTAGIKLD